MRTPSAHRIGFELVKMSDLVDRNEHIALTVNGEDICMPGPWARKLGVSMLRRSDSADDYQRYNNVRTF